MFIGKLFIFHRKVELIMLNANTWNNFIVY